MVYEEIFHNGATDRLRTIPLCVRGVCWGGLMIAALASVMPDQISKIEMEFPEQGKYMKSNLTYLYIEAATWLFFGLGYCHLYFAYGVGSFLLGWALYVTIWNFTQYGVVFGDNWVHSEWDTAVVLMKWIWWLRTIHGSAVCILCVGLLCSVVVAGVSLAIHSAEERSKHKETISKMGQKMSESGGKLSASFSLKIKEPTPKEPTAKEVDFSDVKGPAAAGETELAQKDPEALPAEFDDPPAINADAPPGVTDAPLGDEPAK